MKTYKIYQVDSFTRDRFHGNPAGVVPDAKGLTDEQMLSIARELNNSETAFIFEVVIFSTSTDFKFSLSHIFTQQYGNINLPFFLFDFQVSYSMKILYFFCWFFI